MIIRNIENKVKIATVISITGLITSVLISIGSLYFAYKQINFERQNIYVLDAGIPILVNRTNQKTNREVEYKSHVNLYHNLFFTLPPDDKFIQNNLNKAMYLIDKTGLMEHNNLKEKGYYSRILSSSAVLSIMTDSIHVNMETKFFTYYGTQRIDRRSSIINRTIVTTGKVHDIPRSENNPHGVLITDWRTIANKDISFKQKKGF